MGGLGVEEVRVFGYCAGQHAPWRWAGANNSARRIRSPSYSSFTTNSHTQHIAPLLGFGRLFSSMLSLLIIRLHRQTEPVPPRNPWVGAARLSTPCTAQSSRPVVFHYFALPLFISSVARTFPHSPLTCLWRCWCR